MLATVGEVTIPLAELEELLGLKLRKYAEHDREAPVTVATRYRRSLAERLVRHAQLEQACDAAGVKLSPTRVADAVEASLRGVSDVAEHLRLRAETQASLQAISRASLCEGELVASRVAPVTNEDLAAAYDGSHAKVVATEGWVRLATAAVTPRSAGLPASCNDYLHLYRRCVDERVPDSARAPMIEALEMSEKAWREAATNGVELDESCTAALNAMKQATTSMGCVWERSAAQVPLTKDGKAAAVKQAKRFRARANAKGADFAAVAGAEGLAMTPPGEFVPIESLDTDARAAIARLKPGQVSQPVSTDLDVRVFKLIDRESPGALPLDRVRDTLLKQIQADREKQARASLRAELEQRYPTRWHVEIEAEGK